MKKILIFLLFLICCINFSTYSQITISSNQNGGWIIEDKDDQDFLYNVFANPDFSLYDFYLVGLRSGNTVLRDYSFYTKNKEVMKDCRKNNWNLVEIYKKISISYDIFKQIEYYSPTVIAASSGRRKLNVFSQQYIDYDLRKKLKIVPLKLQIKQ